MRITVISDTHNYHSQLKNDLSGGDLLIHSGDISSRGYRHEIENFCNWFNKLDQYENKIMIAGNHDWGFQDNPITCKGILSKYDKIKYLQDTYTKVDGIKIWGSPWQPEFCNWAFNLQKNGDGLRGKWNLIHKNTDILVTHGPPFGIHDVVDGQYEHLGCELLMNRIGIIKPKMHIFGHIHSARFIEEKDGILFINASILNEQYKYTYKPITFDYDFNTKVWNLIDY